MVKALYYYTKVWFDIKLKGTLLQVVQSPTIYSDQRWGKRSFVINYNPLGLKVYLILMVRFLSVKSSAHVAHSSLNHSGVQNE